MIKVYIASPYSIGDTAINVKRQLDCANELIMLGYAPFVPLYSHFQHMAHPQPYEVWLMLDMEWLNVCDCILRLHGASAGADFEVMNAIKDNKQVFYSIEELNQFYGK